MGPNPTIGKTSKEILVEWSGFLSRNR
jgi:hypothetical protein